MPRHSPGSLVRSAVAAVLVLGLGAAAVAAPLSAEEQAGRKIFEEGLSPSGGAISARVGSSAFDVPGSAVPCANCHGPDGQGRPEGVVVPPNIQWSELTKSYGHVHTKGRKHPAFDETSFRKAVSFGVDPAGNDLDLAMPRYTMSERDLRSLTAYLKKLEFQFDPGVSARHLRIGTVLPASGRFGETGQAVRGMLESYFDGINRKGGIYGRDIELVVADYGEDADAAYANAWEMVRDKDVFALLAPFSAGWEGQLGRIASESRIPVIGPITLFPEDTRASNQQIFHLLAGVAELAQVLAQYGADALNLKAFPVLLLRSQSPAGDALARSLDERMRETGWSQIVGESIRPGAFDVRAFAEGAQRKGVRAVFVLAPGVDVAGIARAAAAIQWFPYLLVPGSLAPRDVMELPAGFQDRVLLAYSTLPADQKPEALREYSAMFRSKPLIRAYQTVQVPAYAGAVALVEVLKRVGRDLNRQKFIAAFESLQDWDTGMLPPLSYNADRRIGSLGGYVVAVDLAARQFRPLGGFIGLER
jgi:ABC-type branched-subunit amino acid transport system substrate-binding protein/cytochrome c553